MKDSAKPIRHNPAALLDVLDAFGRAVSNRDVGGAMAAFSQRPDVLLIGSEQDEIARGPAAIRALVEAVVNGEAGITWEWASREGAVVGDAGYVFADGELVVTTDGAASRRPYRMTGVLVRENGDWRLLCFHGAEPA